MGKPGSADSYAEAFVGTASAEPTIVSYGLRLFCFIFLRQGLALSLACATLGLVFTCGAFAQTTNLSLRYSGQDGSIDYSWTPPVANSLNSLGCLHIQPHFDPVVAPDYSLCPSVQASGAALFYKGASVSQSPSGPVMSLTYSVTAAGSVAETGVVITLKSTLSGKCLSTTVDASSGVIAIFDAGAWPAATPIGVPYYAGFPVYMKSGNVFAHAYFDWNQSSGTQFLSSNAATFGMQSMYGQLTDGSRNPLHERLDVIVSPSIAEVLPGISNPPSPYLSSLSGRVVLDVNGGTFSWIADRLRNLRNYGIRDCVLLVHNWQRSGYDNALPGQYPANPDLGGDNPLRELSSEARASGCYFGLHENYADYYPNYDFFTLSSVSLASSGNAALGYLNAGTGIQAYAAKPSWFTKNAASQSPAIHQTYGTSSSFIDVNSALVPWWKADMDAKTASAGKFTAVSKANSDLWQFERNTHGGPVFGEGANHAYWSGLLDGAEAQVGTGGFATNIGADLPLFVDFDLQRMHPLQVNFGMGYYVRWLKPGQSLSQTDVLDSYRMQQMIFGHAPYLTDDLWWNVPRAMVEQNLAGAVSKRYGTQNAAKIRYMVGGHWTDTNSAAKAADWSQPEVTYGNGDTIFANSKPQPVVWQGLTIPQYGWGAVGSGLLAYTALSGGTVVDYAETPTGIFANARNQLDLASSEAVAQPSLVNIHQTSLRNISLTIKWKALDQQTITNCMAFIHMVNYKIGEPVGGIAFQSDWYPAKPTTMWSPGTFYQETVQLSIPAGVPDATYSLRVGLYDPRTGRVPLWGNDDGTMRYILGDVVISNSAKTVSFRPAPQTPALLPDLRLNMAGTPIDFGTVRTDGMVSLFFDGAVWTLNAFPRSRDIAMQFKSSQIPQPKLVRCEGGTAAPQVSALTNGYWQIHSFSAKSCQW